MLGKLFPCKAKGSAKGEDMEECKWSEQKILLVVRLEKPSICQYVHMHAALCNSCALSMLHV